MSDINTKKIKNITLSLLLHIIIVLLIFELYQNNKKIDSIAQQEIPKEEFNRYVPAYTYSGSTQPKTMPVTKTQPIPTPKTEKATTETQETPTKDEIKETQKANDHIILKPKKSSSMLLASFNYLQSEQLRNIAPHDDDEPMYLVGDSSMPANPLIRLLGRSLSAHFRYPEHAARLGIKGRAVIEFILQTDGTYSEIRLLKSTGDHDLDGAALYAVNSAPTIPDVKHYISQPKRFVIGFLFH